MKPNSLKKIISGILAIGLMSTINISTNISAISNDDVQLQNGDINNDGSINYIDVLEMKKILLGISQLDNDNIADLNKDNSVNAMDLAILKGMLFGNDIVNPIVTTPVVTDPPVVTQDAVLFTFSNTGVTAFDINGNQVDSEMVDGTIVTITTPGEYSFEGECDNGQIIVNVDKTTYPKSAAVSAVTLNLQGLTLSNSTTSPIYVESIDDVCEISAKKKTTNTISDGTSYTNADGGVGAIYSRDDIKFKGKGELIVNGNCEDGIVSKNDIKIWNSTLTVNAVDDGIRGKDAVKIGDPDDLGIDGSYDDLKVTVNAEKGDGIKSTNYEDESKGKVNINGGIITINSYGDGIEAQQEININGGDIDITTTATISSSGGNQGGWGGMQEGNSSSTDISSKGIKASLNDTSILSVEENINITGGSINITSNDDGIHSNGDINVTGGTMIISSGDDGIHADNVLTLGTQGGTDNDFIIEVNQSYEGIEAYDIEVYSGTTAVLYASDDGFNASGGNDNSGNNNNVGWGQGGFGPGSGMSSSTGIINIYGGYIYSRAEGDGFDSNGNITMSGGTLLVCGPTRGGNGIFDKGDGNYSFTVTGGIVLGMGTSDMQDNPTNCTLTTATGTLSANSLIAISNSSDGEAIAVLKVPSDMNMNGLVVYADGGNTSYSVYSVDENNYTGSIDKYGFGIGGNISGGSQLTGSSNGGNGGGFNPGGGRW